MADDANPRAVIGANEPPEPIEAEAILMPEQKAYQAHKLNIEGLFEQATQWIDGTGIENEAQAEKVQTLLRMIQEAESAADTSRVAEKKPLDEQIAGIQGRYNPLIAPIKNAKPGLTSLAIKGCNDVLTKWLVAQQAKADEEARLARIEADRLAEEARLAVQAAQESDAPDLTAILEAQEAVEDAQGGAQVAKRAENFRPAVRGYGRAATLRTYYTPTLADPVKVLGWCWANMRPEMEAALIELAKTRLNGGVCPIPGITVTSEQRV